MWRPEDEAMNIVLVNTINFVQFVTSLIISPVVIPSVLFSFGYSHLELMLLDSLKILNYDLESDNMHSIKESLL